MSDSGGAEAWTYDALGRVLTDRRTTNGITKDFVHTYNLDASLATLTYPSNRQITYSYNAAGRPVSAVDVVGAGPINYATNALYAPAGALASLNSGASLVSTFFYNNRLQPCRIHVKSSGSAPTNCADLAQIANVLDFSYGFNHSTANNGNVVSIANNRNNDRTQTFTYDELNRIKMARTQATTGPHAWGLEFGYDIWANLRSASVTQGNPPVLSVDVNENNRIVGFCYDAAGNLLSETASPCPPPAPTYTYDAENRMTATEGVTYTYDGDGKRVQKSTGKLYWYGAGSEVLTETDAAGSSPDEFIFFGAEELPGGSPPGRSTITSPTIWAARES